MTEQEKEFTEIKSWKMLTGSGVKVIRNCTYIEMMEDFFEGYNIPREYNLETKEVESFESANDRVCRYLNISKTKSEEVFSEKDRDTFAIGFAEWVGSEGYKRMSNNRTTWWGREWLEHQTTSELLDLFKQSLKTDNK